MGSSDGHEIKGESKLGIVKMAFFDTFMIKRTTRVEINIVLFQHDVYLYSCRPFYHKRIQIGIGNL